MNAQNYIGKMVDVVVDRPMSSKHPKYDMIYPINYGYVPHTVSGDKEELDVYILGVDRPIEKFVGKCVAVIHRTDDDDDKLVVISDGDKTPTEADIRAATDFQEKWFKSEIIF